MSGRVMCPCCEGAGSHIVRVSVDEIDEMECRRCEGLGLLPACAECNGEGWYEYFTRGISASGGPVAEARRGRCDVCNGTGVDPERKQNGTPPPKPRLPLRMRHDVLSHRRSARDRRTSPIRRLLAGHL